jgi:hypothetical protein
MTAQSLKRAASDLRQALEQSPGYYLGLKFTATETARIRELIRMQWLGRIAEVAPQHVTKFEAISMDRYHEHSDLLPHGSVWTKQARILNKRAASEIRGMSLFKALENQLGGVLIADEERVGWDLMYWRLVRPNSQGDVGPLHADKWFWDIGEKEYVGVVPTGYTRAKLWTAVFCESGTSGLRLVPDSHETRIPYTRVESNGTAKPVIAVDEASLRFGTVSTQPGEAVLFHDRLIHGGSKAACSLSRVSFELTILYR